MVLGKKVTNADEQWRLLSESSPAAKSSNQHCAKSNDEDCYCRRPDNLLCAVVNCNIEKMDRFLISEEPDSDNHQSQSGQLQP